VRDSILVATGTGIAPFRGMLAAYLGAGGDRDVMLIYGVRYEESLLYRTEFEELERRHSNFCFRPTLSRPDEGWTGRCGHVQSHVMEALGDRRDMDVYICGLKLMVDDVRSRLKEAGLDRKQIVFEKYD
jgi:CDP-4-dehydro-6-deoxyglucose reductase